MSFLLNNITEEQKKEAINDLINDSTPRSSFFFLVILSVLMATCGLLIDNSAVIIASMLIAPIMSPILSLALGIVIADSRLILRSLATLGKSALWGVGLSAIATLALWGFTSSGNFHTDLNPSIMERINPSVVYLLIAVIAGAATAFTRVKPDLSEALPGTAIAVALVPPLATIGIGISTFRLEVVSGALMMFLLNAAGIIFSAMVMFSLMNIYRHKEVAKQFVIGTDQELENEMAMEKMAEGE